MRAGLEAFSITRSLLFGFLLPHFDCKMFPNYSWKPKEWPPYCLVFGLKTNASALPDCLGVFVSEFMSFSIAV